MIDVGDVEQIGPNEYQPAPLRFQNKDVAMKWSRGVAEAKELRNQNLISAPAFERFLTRLTWQCRDEDTRATSGIIVVRR
jgi:hypothetical protein